MQDGDEDGAEDEGEEDGEEDRGQAELVLQSGMNILKKYGKNWFPRHNHVTLLHITIFSPASRS